MTLAPSTNGPTLRSRTERDIVDDNHEDITSENSYEEFEYPINDEGNNQTNFKFIVPLLKIVIKKCFHLFYLLQ
jgi:hypothetical protein